MSAIAIIGGTGLTRLGSLEIARREVIHTPYGEPSGPVTHGHLFGREVAFLPRHGPGHTIPPHQVNYRANLWALHHIGVEQVIAVAAVGGITERMKPACLVIPDQIIDYTWSRAHTFYEGSLKQVTHVDFTEPYSLELRHAMIAACAAAGIGHVDRGTYGATQGPRLESTAEIDRMARDGCDLVGMTGMPEAGLARELGLSYATCAVVANWAAGRGTGEITMEEVGQNLDIGMRDVARMLEALMPLL
ncbi:S-methyl-5'-thioinosine phosphorylase [Acidihalobacter prosperus]|uniref:Probable S-methyl-5'-thioinosine phosphorylase n=1 Tax=Acidihalobacter prosperus TaxID=160660 RepID=A0A1A6C8L6_9GAMM|nr:S-methyl-5'-thioinosine phosphorylase [Acidihalobacter prosperus]OBS10889.1 5'-methylthioadenosine phosphorylase [Acidihalobacter prosperus]